ncbi:MAG TPA: hypothetical protein VK939_00450 [Longimicrobiales bacterium]|nr:hypothetical protein [Longimicrobiales bacterium]
MRSATARQRFIFRLTLAGAVAVLGAAAPLAGQEHVHPEGDAEALGKVSFPVSCAAPAAAEFERGVAMLHSFWFEAAATTFRHAAELDPACAMAQWGLAMTLLGNPMTRQPPSEEHLREGSAAAESARALAAKASHREQMYIDAVTAYYGNEAADHASRMKAHEAALAALQQAHGDDPEATIFLARAMVANAPPSDLTFAKQLAGAELMQPLFAKSPEHPGLAHYLIHAYDAPALAERGSKAAFAYAEIAPSAPHALHMPSHIFTRLGYWDESIEANARSARAEPDSNAAVHPLDYMVYAFLQQGRDAEAKRVVDRAVSHADRFYGGIIGYNFAAMPARHALEREDWAAAAALAVPDDAPPFARAVTRFARAIGAARSGALDAAEAEVAALRAVEDELRNQSDSYWTTVVQAQRTAAEAWIAQGRGDAAEATRLARAAADLEETVEKHPVTPGPLLPARELEGDLLLALERPAEALAAYEQTLKREPRRARALYGAARSAEAAGQADAARAHYAALLDVMSKADAGRPQVADAKRFLAAH